MMTFINNRVSIRYELSQNFCLMSDDDGLTWSEISLLNISNEGVFIGHLLKPQDRVLLRFKMPGDLGNLTMPFRVARTVWTANKKAKVVGSGGTLTFATQAQRKIWESMVVFMRNKQIIEISKRIIAEFGGKDLFK